MRIHRWALVAGILAAGLACGGDSADPNRNTGRGALTTSINGQAFSAPASSVQATLAQGVLVIGAAQTSNTGAVRSIGVAIQNAAVGVFATGGGNPTVVTYSETTGSTQTWTSALSSSAGSLRINVLTATRAAGEFVNVPLQSGSGGTRTISGGRFDVTINASY